MLAAQALALALFLLLPSSVRAAAVKDNLYGVKALSSTEAIAVGNFGSIYQTRAGGRSWQPRESGSKLPLFGVDFADAEHGWAVGKSSLVLATTDGGATWKTQKCAIPPEKHLFQVEAIDARTAWVVGDWGAISMTRDGGATWENRSLGTFTVKTEDTAGGRTTSTLTDDVILFDVDFPDRDHGYIAGEFGTVLATRDGGATWEKQNVGTEKTLFGVGFETAEKGWVVGIDGLIIRTTDGGKSWQVQHGRTSTEDIEELGFLATLENPSLYDVQVIGGHGAVIGDTGKILTTADGGETWTSHPTSEKERLVWMRALSLVPGTRGFIVGAGGFAAQLADDELVMPDRVATER